MKGMVDRGFQCEAAGVGVGVGVGVAAAASGGASANTNPLHMCWVRHAARCIAAATGVREPGSGSTDGGSEGGGHAPHWFWWSDAGIKVSG